MTFDLVQDALGVILVAMTLPGTLLLLALSLASLRGARPAPPTRRTGRAVIVVPAHNEEGGIAATVAALREQAALDGACEVVVVADNCEDATAQRARAAGARVLVRQHRARRGKGHALHYAFERLAPEGHELFFVVDADSRLVPGFLLEMRRAFDAGAPAAQARYTVLNAGESARTRLMTVALAAFNILRPRGRAALGLSAGIYGNGFALHRDALRAVPYQAGSVTEDVEYHLLLVRAGINVAFVDRATVLAEMPAGGSAAGTQRARWEGGRLRLAATRIPGLAHGVLQGRWRELEPLADLALLPLAYHALALVALLLLPAPWSVAGWLGAATLALHVGIAARVAGIGARPLFAALLGVPAYVIWKLLNLPRTLRAGARHAPWVRTARAVK